MKKIISFSSLAILSAFVFFTNTTQAEFVAGKNYIVLDKTIETELIHENLALKNEFDNILKNGFQNIYYIKDMKIDELDNEGTVDGVHLTDLGFLRYADYLIENFKKFKLIKD
jgi:hypothetical protein